MVGFPELRIVILILYKLYCWFCCIAPGPSSPAKRSRLDIRGMYVQVFMFYMIGYNSMFYDLKTSLLLNATALVCPNSSTDRNELFYVESLVQNVFIKSWTVKNS